MKFKRKIYRTQEELDRICERAKEWVMSPEGQAEIAERQKALDEMFREMERQRKKFWRDKGYIGAASSSVEC